MPYSLQLTLFLCIRLAQAYSWDRKANIYNITMSWIVAIPIFLLHLSIFISISSEIQKIQTLLAIVSDSSHGTPNINFAMAPVYEHLHNKRLRKQNGMSLPTLKCLPSILKKIDEQFFPYLYVCCGNIFEKHASTNCKQLALAQRNEYQLLPQQQLLPTNLAFVHTPPYLQLVFYVHVKLPLEVSFKAKDCSQLFHIFVFRVVQFCPTSCFGHCYCIT